MLTLSAVRDWLKSYNIANNYYVGKIDTSKEQAVCVYSRKRSGSPVTALGGHSSYEIKSITLLLRWNKNATQSEKTAIQLFKSIKSEHNLKIDNIPIQFISMTAPESIALGTDEQGIYEYVIEFDIYYERNEI